MDGGNAILNFGHQWLFEGRAQPFILSAFGMSKVWSLRKGAAKRCKKSISHDRGNRYRKLYFKKHL